jgi:hypothetical protein
MYRTIDPPTDRFKSYSHPSQTAQSCKAVPRDFIEYRITQSHMKLNRSKEFFEIVSLSQASMYARVKCLEKGPGFRGTALQD